MGGATLVVGGGWCHGRMSLGMDVEGVISWLGWFGGT